MTADPIEPVDPEIDESYADDIDDGPTVEDNSGQVASRVAGDMVQNVHNWLGRYQAARELSDAFVQETIATFVERVYGPGGMSREAAARILLERRHVLLVADPGTGRRTQRSGYSAPFPRHGGRSRSTTTSGGSCPSTRCRGRRTAVPPTCSRCRPETGTGGCGSCSSPIGRPLKRDSYLVVLVDQKSLEGPEEVPGFTVLTVTAPVREELLSRLLDDQRARLDVDTLIETPPLPAMLADATPVQTARLSRRIRAAAADPQEPLAEIARKSVQAYQNWDEELGDWFENNADPRTRLFLIAMAFLQGGQATNVLHATEKLAEKLQEPARVRGGIGAPGIRQLAKNVSARIDDQYRIFFTLPSYDVAILRYCDGPATSSCQLAMSRPEVVLAPASA